MRSSRIQALIAIVCVLAIAGGLAYLACFMIAFFFANVEEMKQPGGPSKSAVAIWTYLGTCLLIWLLR